MQPQWVQSFSEDDYDAYCGSASGYSTPKTSDSSPSSLLLNAQESLRIRLDKFKRTAVELFSAPKWDGDEALPITQEALQALTDLVNKLPKSMIFPPNFSAAPNGQTVLYWKTKDSSLSISVSASEEIHFCYSTKDKKSKMLGVEHLSKLRGKSPLLLIIEEITGV